MLAMKGVFGASKVQCYRGEMKNEAAMKNVLVGNITGIKCQFVGLLPSSKTSHSVTAVDSDPALDSYKYRGYSLS